MDNEEVGLGLTAPPVKTSVPAQRRSVVGRTPYAHTPEMDVGVVQIAATHPWSSGLVTQHQDDQVGGPQAAKH